MIKPLYDVIFDQLIEQRDRLVKAENKLRKKEMGNSDRKREEMDALIVIDAQISFMNNLIALINKRIDFNQIIKEFNSQPHHFERRCPCSSCQFSSVIRMLPPEKMEDILAWKENEKKL